MSDYPPEHASTAQLYEFFRGKTGNDPAAAALLTLAETIRTFDGVRVWLNADPDSDRIRIDVDDVDDAADAIKELARVLKPESERKADLENQRRRIQAMADGEGKKVLAGKGTSKKK
jgi:hypothetical protein